MITVLSTSLGPARMYASIAQREHAVLLLGHGAGARVAVRCAGVREVAGVVALLLQRVGEFVGGFVGERTDRVRGGNNPYRPPVDAGDGEHNNDVPGTVISDDTAE